MNPAESQFAVIGHPIGHTMSPFIHARLFALSGKQARYGVLDIPPEAMAEKAAELKKLSGFNVTIPHKQAILPLLDNVDEKAAGFHSVNTVKIKDGRMTGFTTDGTGFSRALETAGVKLSGRTVILGAGGAARALAFEAALRGGKVTVAARQHSMEAARQLCSELNDKTGNLCADCCRMDEISGEIDLLANATPVGMYPNTSDCPVAEETVRRAACVFDAVYNPNETQLLRLARKNGIRTVGGMSMLVWQAAAAHEIWYGARFRSEDMDQLCTDAVLEMKKKFGNLILCGFMGSGKTTVGSMLAQRTNRIFVDMDRSIEKNTGMTVSEIFARFGEPEFRRLEQEEASALSQKSNLVIAVGGGTLMNPENTAVLKENGVVVLLDAGLETIRQRLKNDRTRPLLAAPDRSAVMERLYEQRIGIYRAAADYIIPADESARRVAESIYDALHSAEHKTN